MLKRIKEFFIRFKKVDKTITAIQFLTDKIIVLKSMKKELECEISEVKTQLTQLKLEIVGVLNE